MWGNPSLKFKKKSQIHLTRPLISVGVETILSCTAQQESVHVVLCMQDNGTWMQKSRKNCFFPDSAVSLLSSFLISAT